MAAGGAETVDDGVERLARPAAQRSGAERELQPVFKHSRRQRPVHLVEPDEEVGDLGDDVRLGHRPAPADDQLVVEERVGQRVLKRGEVALGKLGVADLGQQVLVGARKEPDQRPIVQRAGLAGIARGLGLDPVQERGRQLRRHDHPLLDQVAGHHRAGRAEMGADVAEQARLRRTPPVSWWSMTTCGMAASLKRRPVYGWVSTMTTAVSGSVTTVSTGTSGTGISSTIARFSDRAIIPSTVRITGLPG